MVIRKMPGRILCVAEKPSIAKAVAGHLSGGKFSSVWIFLLFFSVLISFLISITMLARIIIILFFAFESIFEHFAKMILGLGWRV
jgi:hypothetical protein